jgi:mitochondrial fission protein ELM1
LKASLLITPSRRTSPDALRVLNQQIAQVPHFLWDGQGNNPYFGILGLADYLVVTCDSVNMVSEAASTGKPVYVLDLSGGSEKFARFHRAMREDRITRPFAGKLEPYSYVPPDDMALVAARVNALFPARGAF